MNNAATRAEAVGFLLHKIDLALQRSSAPNREEGISLSKLQWMAIRDYLDEKLGMPSREPKRLDPSKKYLVGEIDSFSLLGRQRPPLPRHELMTVRLLEVLETLTLYDKTGETTFQIWLCQVGEGRASELLEIAEYELVEME